MSLDLTLYKDDEEIMWMNWLRNPFGLEMWAQCNFDESKNKFEVEQSLYYVCNHWSYESLRSSCFASLTKDDSNDVDRKLFHSVVTDYWSVIQTLESSYFGFPLSSYIQFIQPNYHHFPKEKLFTGDEYIKDSKYSEDDTMLLIPVKYFQHRDFCLSEASTQRYKKWFYELVQFAEKLQDKSLRFECSN